MDKKHNNSHHNSVQHTNSEHNAHTTRKSVSTSHRSSSRQSKTSKASKVLTAAAVEEKIIPLHEEKLITSYKLHTTDEFFQFLVKGIMSERKDGESSGKKVNISVAKYMLETSEESLSKDDSLKEIVDKKEDFRDSDTSLKTDQETVQSPSNMSKSSSFDSCVSECKCVHKIAFQNGNIYEGTIDNGVMHGQGSFKWSDGTSYAGDFVDGFPHGKGKMVLPDLSTYEGEFSNGFFHGKGTLNVASSPVLYSGFWKEGKKNGRGWLHYDSENYYDGEFENGFKHGFGYRHYKNGTQYRGEWQNGIIHGNGSMLWNNNDYCSGFWKDGLQNGYGEYIWGVMNHNDLVFANYNCYKGNWVKGKREGAGIMNFGHESGAKLAGMFKDNEKHGPENARSLITFKEIQSQVKLRENLDKLNDSSLTKITKSGCDIRKSQFVKLLEKNAANEPLLKIPVQTNTEDVDFSFWISILLSPPGPLATDSDVEVVEVKTQINETGSPMGLSGVNFVASSKFTLSNRNLLSKSISQQNIPRITEESKKLKNLITNNLEELKAIYNIYATMGCDKNKDHEFKPVLVRLFLWQLYWDIGLTNITGAVSIVDADEALAINPKSCLDSFYEPFEPIYFWQFLQALVSTSTLIFVSTETDYLPISGIMFYIFKEFLETCLYPNVGKFSNTCLTSLKDLIPIQQVYRLYTKIGEPHSVSEFLKETCLRRGKEVPCYKNFRKANLKNTLISGYNTVVFNNEVEFIEDSKSGQESLANPTILGLYTFGESLGRSTVLKCLVKICPQIINKKKYQLQYRLSFIEFYEVLLTMAFEKVEQERLKLIADLHIPSQKIDEDKMSKSGPPSPLVRVGSVTPSKKKKSKT